MALFNTDYMWSSAARILNAGYSGGQECLDIMILGGELGFEADKAFQVMVTTHPLDNIVFRNNRTDVIIHDGIEHCYK